MIQRVAIWLLVLSSLITGCTGSTNTPVPRRTAYPRAYVYDSAFVTEPTTPVTMKVNAKADVTSSINSDGSVWATSSYPRYGAKLYCTFTPVTPATAADVIANRRERISLNLGSVRPHTETFTNPAGYFSTLVVAPSVPTTPIQFISVQPERPEWVVSGMVFFDSAAPISSVDSIEPIISILNRDVQVMLKNLGL